MTDIEDLKWLITHWRGNATEIQEAFPENHPDHNKWSLAAHIYNECAMLLEVTIKRDGLIEPATTPDPLCSSGKKEKAMKVFTAVFDGKVYGGDAIIVANDELDARVLLTNKLRDEGLLQKNNGKHDATLQEIDTSTPGVNQFFDGDE